MPGPSPGMTNCVASRLPAPATGRAAPPERRSGERFGADRLHRIAGKPLDITPCLFRFLWHAEHEPALFHQAAMYADVNATIAFHLVGEWVTPTASADPMGMLDMA